MTRITVNAPSSVTVTQRPHWLARVVLGRKETVREATRIHCITGSMYSCRWIYTDNCDVEPDVADAIEKAIGTP